ncbi:hypothetical protein JCM11491_006321, partial [Sporobolomyces phaffii]
FLTEMHQMLGPDAMASLSPSATASPTTRLTLTSTSSPPASSPGPNRQTYNVSGVLLNEEEYRQYSHTEDQSARSRAQQWLSSATRYVPVPTHFQYAPQPSPGYELDRPRSAPPSPQVDLATAGQFVPFYSPPSPPPHHSEFHQHSSLSGGPFVASAHAGSGSGTSSYNARPFHRRGSSVDATVPRTFVSTLSIPAAYGYASYPTTVPSPSPPSTRSNQPVGYPPPACFPLPTPPPSHPRQLHPDHRYDATPPPRLVFPARSPRPIPSSMLSCSSASISTLDDEAPISPISPIRGATGGGGGHEGKYRYRPSAVEPVPSSPSPSTGAVTGPTARGHRWQTKAHADRSSSSSISFINFSASDSKALLSGVAPSGSSKKRLRDPSVAAAAGGEGGSEGDEVEGSAKKARN